MKKIYLSLAIAVLFLFSSCTANNKDSDYFESEATFFAMDTAVNAKGTIEEINDIKEIVTELNGLFDRYSEKSDIYALNQRIETEISPFTEEILEQSVSLSDLYGNDVSIFAGDITDCWNTSADNPKVPEESDVEKALQSFRNTSFSLDSMTFEDDNGSIDLGCVAKGYVLDKIREKLDSNNCYIVSMTSSVLLNGKKSNGEKFSVSLRDPSDGSKSLGTFETDACFLSTSGGYERFFEIDGIRYSHIFDLTEGRPSETDLTSVTVFCDSGITSDFLSTLIYIGGTENLGKYLSSEEFKIAAVTNDMEIYLSKGVNFTPESNSGYSVKEWSYE